MENRRNNIIRALRAEKNENVGDGKNEFRKKAFNKHIRAIETYPNPIQTMKNVEKAYNTSTMNDGTKLFKKGIPTNGRPFKIIEETLLYPTHHIQSLPMATSMQYPQQYLQQQPIQPPIQVPWQAPMQAPRQVERKIPKVIRRRSVKHVHKEVLPKAQRRALSVKQKKPASQKVQKDYKKDILIRLLELQAVEHGNGKDDRRKKAFQRHINAIMKFPYEIETIEDLRTIYRKAHLPTHGIAYKAIHTLLPLKNITRRKQVVYQPSSFL